MNEEDLKFTTLPKIKQKFKLQGDDCIVTDVFVSRFGDWKISYTQKSGGAGIVNLDYFARNAILTPNTK